MRHLLSIAVLLTATVCALGADDLILRFDTDGDFEGWTPVNFEESRSRWLATRVTQTTVNWSRRS